MTTSTSTSTTPSLLRTPQPKEIDLAFLLRSINRCITHAHFGLDYLETRHDDH